jgi:hypothetical protein
MIERSAKQSARPHFSIISTATLKNLSIDRRALPVSVSVRGTH